MDRQQILTVIAAVCLAVVVALEVGASIMLPPSPPVPAAIDDALRAEGVDDDEREDALEQLDEVASADDPPGLAIPALALLDVFLLVTFSGLALSTVVSHRTMGKVTAPFSLVVSILVLLAGIVLLLVTLALLFLMIGLFLAVPFGTITYLARWGFFPRGGAQALLGLILGMKLAFVVAATAAAPRNLRNKGLVALVITSFVAQLLVSLLHGFVPLPLVSIADAVAAIIVIILALIWAVIHLVGSAVGTLRLIRFKTG